MSDTKPPFTEQEWEAIYARSPMLAKYRNQSRLVMSDADRRQLIVEQMRVQEAATHKAVVGHLRFWHPGDTMTDDMLRDRLPSSPTGHTP